MRDVEMNLEFFRWLNLDSQLVSNEDSDDAWEDKLKVSDDKTSSSTSELDSNAGSGQVSESLVSNFLLDETEDEMMLDEDWTLESVRMDRLLKLSFSSDEIEDVIGAWMDELKESKELKILMKDLDPFFLLKMSSTFPSSNLASRIAILFFKLPISFLISSNLLTLISSEVSIADEGN